MPSPDTSPGTSLDTSLQGTLQGSAATMLAVGIVALEFVAAVSTFVAGALLPLVEADLHAERQVPLLLAGSTVGMFTALPFAARTVRGRPARQVLVAGLVLTAMGAGVSAAAPTAWVFAGGRFASGFASAVLAVYGISAAIRHLEDPLRLKVVAATSAMWVLPATVGPSATLALEHVAGWRLTMLAPLPLTVVARVLVMRVAPPQSPESPGERPARRALLVPVGVAAFVVLSGSSWWFLAPFALVPAVTGFLALVPAGTARLVRGAPAALAGLTLFGAGYFGASGVVTLVFTQTFDTSLFQAGAALSVAPITWALASVVTTRVASAGVAPGWGMTVAAAGVVSVGVAGLAGASWRVALLAWTFVGVGVGLSYPALYVRATTRDGSTDATALAAAAITTESFGGLVGSTAAGGLGSVGVDLGLDRAASWSWAFLGLGCLLAAAALASVRSGGGAGRG